MKKQTGNILSIAVGLFPILFSLGMFVAVPLYGVAVFLGHGYPFSRLLFFSALFVIIGELFVFFPLAFLTTRHLKNDPFRFSPKLKAYFKLSEPTDFENLMKSVEKEFNECEAPSKTQIKATWKPVADNDLQTFYVRSARRSQKRSIVIKLLDGWEGFKEQRAEVTIETGAYIKLINGDGLNQVALQVLMQALNWEKYRVPVNSNGEPQW